ncbi:hypothetical protein ORJ04_21600 [Rheinheimera baltica]|uniref:Uncharacterized protein n=1 Tax=Rheinheimera baltica TaxID=67576 RepID=A0ABT9I566_9GAMM|nr:hypothetical protein [Rheinheimera baltica]MDP5138546.1 hypothetical protein [Rheinheimera baltica]MDP5144046.1 hypothetical protein [Rheinheimera baltica]MDP5148856.1 hypothetical protein [Rheinheimera baltica]
MRLILIIFTLFSVSANACRPAFRTIAEHINESTSVHVGYVTGVTNKSFESHVTLKKSDDIIMVPESFSMRVAVSETLKGKNFEIIEEAYTHCSRKFKLKEKVVIFIKPDYDSAFILGDSYLDELYKEFN